MTWITTPNVAMYKGASWDNFIKKVPGCTPQAAKRIAWQDPDITFFFFCREYMVLENLGAEGVFNPGDAVFFSGDPWFGSAPQCDSYQKNYMTIAYLNAKTPDQFRETACYVLADGSPAIDVVCIFAGNYASDELPYLRAKNNDPPTTEPFNPDIQTVLDSGAVKDLQDKGIIVLLTVMNGHAPVGWSEFTSESDATAFVQYLQTEVVDKYGLDGIDIDDEWSSGTANDTSLIMVTSIMKEMMPDKIISKALWSDQEYFQSSYQGKTLADTLTYGWEMSYGTQPEYVLPFYVSSGMAKNTVSKGFYSSSPSPTPSQDIQWIKDNGYGGIMIFAFDDQSNVDLMGSLVDDLYGAGNWNKDSNCPS